jgi:hypothetical protein
MAKRRTASKKTGWEAKLEKGYEKFKEVKEEAGEKLEDFENFIRKHPLLAVAIAFFAGMMWERMFGKR